ncbi:MAG: sortase, partial [Chloroflexi bacterium]|nr:sortase [Chloroflexota bacterium]
DSAAPTLTWTVDQLDDGESVTLTFQAEVQPTGERQNTAEITAADQTDPDDTNNSDSATLGYEPEADLSVTKDDGRTLVVAGDTVVYTIVVTNHGPNDVTAAQVTDAKPASITSWTWECDSLTGGASGCDGVTDSTADFSDTVDLPANGSITYKVTAHIAASASGTLENTVEVALPAGSDIVDPTPDNNQATDIDTLAAASKRLVDTNQDFTTGNEVAIGEIVTYEATLNIPVGQVQNLTLTDIMAQGLAFVTCESITASGPLTSTAGTLDSICANPAVSAEPAGSAAAEDQGRKVVWDFGTVTNATGDEVTLTVRYQAVVLDSAGNITGTSLANQAEWAWDDGRVQASAAAVNVIEPDLNITKTANPTVVLPDEPVTFTLAVGHTSASQIDAYDVVVTDPLPAGMEYVNGSLQVVSGPTPTRMDYDPATRTIQVTWDAFALGDAAQIQFQVTLNANSATQTTNEAAVAWTSLPGDVSQPQSPYNTLSTERRYDPNSPVDIYRAAATADLQMVLPETGFAPGRVTAIPPQKVAYAATEMVLEIPRLGVSVPIVGIPRTDDGWDLTWLWNRAGWLEGTAFPTWAGNTAITAHVYLPNGQPGPFVHLGRLMWGDRIVIRAYGQQYIYEVRRVRLVAPDDLSVLRHEEHDWLTLITCRDYDPRHDTYRQRLVVQAVLVEVRP